MYGREVSYSVFRNQGGDRERWVGGVEDWKEVVEKIKDRLRC